MSRAPLKRTRFGAALLAVAFLAAQMVAFGHQASVRHATCPEHGELVDTIRDAQDGAVAPDAATVATSTLANRAAPSHGHDHCSIWSPRREPLGHLPAAVLAGEVPATDGLLSSADAPREIPTIAILRLAPKTSPPA